MSLDDNHLKACSVLRCHALKQSEPLKSVLMNASSLLETRKFSEAKKILQNVENKDVPDNVFEYVERNSS